MGEHHLSQRRGLQGGGREASGQAACDIHRGAVVMPRTTAEHAEIAANSSGLVLSGLGGLCGERRLHNFRKTSRRRRSLLAIALGCVVISDAASAAQLPLEPARESGQSITAAYEGWFKNA